MAGCANGAERAMRIGLISTDYPPLRTSAAVQMRDLAVELKSQGHDPVVLVSTTDLKAPSELELIDGVTVLRLCAPRTRGLDYFRRTIGELSLPFLMLHRLRASPLRDVNWDLIVWYSPPIFFGPLVWWLKRSSGCPTYLILRDIFPEWAVDLGLLRKGLAYAFFKAIAHLQYAVADVIGVQTHSNLGYFRRWTRGRSKRIEVLHNWQSSFADIGSTIKIAATPLAGRKIMVYIGNMGVAQGMGILIDLAQEMLSREDVGFVFVGRGSEVPCLKAEVASRRLSNVLFFDEVDSREMPGLLTQCFAGLLSLDPRHRTHNIPGKFLTYLLAGLPVIARVNPGTDIAQLINAEGVGYAYDGECPRALQEFIEKIVADRETYARMSERGRALAAEMFSSERAARQLIESVRTC